MAQGSDAIPPDFSNALPSVLVEVAVNGNKVVLTLPMRYVGAAATLQNIQTYTEAIQQKWTNTFGKYDVTLIVTTPGADVPSSKLNTITVLDGPSNAVSSVDMTRGFFGLGALNPGNTGTFYAPSATGQVAAHEAGHLMGLPDQYTSSIGADNVRTTTPNLGYENNIMGTLTGTPSEADISRIINANPGQPASGSSGNIVAPSPAPAGTAGTGGGSK